ncbi:hypothetical protein [Klebsiella variicola]|uniref:hypothetical protein n=1 Tax=Klebsiella variicola TaxID=244366 RepID=UPI002404DF00|nr:hypothetical protein [Klebsiella variicola]MDG0490067.1 hypothetical protein [Klebsiella variicola]
MKSFLFTVLIFLSVSNVNAAEKIEVEGLQAFKYTCDNGTTPINYNDGADGVIAYRGVKYMHTSTTEDGASYYESTKSPHIALTVKWEGHSTRFTAIDTGLTVDSTLCV